MQAELYIGPAGWSYPDWNGIVYPKRRPRGFDPLVHLASYFNLIEINSTFYRVPEPAMCRSWANRTSGMRDFKFSVKAFREFTHERAAAGEKDVAAFKRVLDPLVSEDRLTAVLVQFPWSFRFSGEACRYVRALNRWLSPLPVCVEVRHGSWGAEAAADFFRGEGITLCGIDQPLIGDSIGPDVHLAGPHGAYFRFHGRNREQWFKRATNRDLRYNYLYSNDELSAWAERIKRVAKSVHKIHVVLNNHFRGQAPANALELRSMLAGDTPSAPAELVRAFPALQAITKATDPSGAADGSPRSQQPSLFEDNEQNQREQDAAGDEE